MYTYIIHVKTLIFCKCSQHTTREVLAYSLNLQKMLAQISKSTFLPTLRIVMDGPEKVGLLSGL